MPTNTPPALGYGNRNEASLNDVNTWMRSQPWYQEQLIKWGQDPNNVHLTDTEKQDIIKLAQANGVVVDEGHNGQEIDDSGNFHAKSHALRNTMIVAGIAAAAIATMGAAGVFSAAAAPAAGAGLGGVEAGATAGLGATALPGAMATLPALSTVAPLASTAIGAGFAPAVEGGTGLATGAGSTAADIAAAADVLPSTTTAAGSAALPTGLASGTDAAAAGAGAAGYTVDAAGNVIDAANVPPDAGSSLGQTLGKTLGKFGDVAGSVGQAIGKANTAAGNNRLDQEQLGLTANGQNITGQSAFEQELMNRAKEEDIQRGKAAKDVYRASYNANPRVSPFDPVGAPRYSPQYLSVARGLADQGANTLKNPAIYATSAQPALKPYTPIDPKDVPGSTNTQQGTLSKIGDYVGPGLSVAQQIAKWWGK